MKLVYKWKTYQSESAFLVISKTFNLPRIHLISGHIGVGNHRFASGDRPVGLFAGISTEFHPAFARGDIALSLEFDGAGINGGVRHTADSGLQVALGVETLNLNFVDKWMMEQIAGAKRLARQAGKLNRKISDTSSQFRGQMHR